MRFKDLLKPNELISSHRNHRHLNKRNTNILNKPKVLLLSEKDLG